MAEPKVRYNAMASTSFAAGIKFLIPFTLSSNNHAASLREQTYRYNRIVPRKGVTRNTTTVGYCPDQPTCSPQSLVVMTLILQNENKNVKWPYRRKADPNALRWL